MITMGRVQRYTKKPKKEVFVELEFDASLLLSMLEATDADRKKNSSKTVIARRKRAVRVICEMVRDQLLLNDGKRLDLSDKAISKFLHCSLKEASYIRRMLNNAKVLSTPKGFEAKKPGDYPIYRVETKLFKKVVTKSEVKKQSKPRKKTYKDEYYSEFENIACLAVIKNWEINWADKLGPVIPASVFYSAVNRLVAYDLQQAGLTREDMRI